MSKIRISIELRQDEVYDLAVDELDRVQPREWNYLTGERARPKERSEQEVLSSLIYTAVARLAHRFELPLEVVARHQLPNDRKDAD